MQPFVILFVNFLERRTDKNTTISADFIAKNAGQIDAANVHYANKWSTHVCLFVCIGKVKQT